MLFPVSKFALIVGVLTSVGALSPYEIPTDLPVSSLLASAQIHLANGETNEALVYYDAAIARDPANYLSFFKRATTFLSLGRSVLAQQDFDRVLVLKPGFPGAHLQLAKIKSKAGEWDEARKEYAAAGKGLDSVEIADLIAAEKSAELAKTAKQSNEWEDCVNHAGTAILVASRSVSLRELRSHCRFERGELEEVIGDLRHVLQMRPGVTTPHVVISAISFYGLADFDSGLVQLRRCLHSDPESKICKNLHKQQKAMQKAIEKAHNQLNRGQTTTAGKTLVGSDEEQGVVSKLQEQIAQLRESGSIPLKARLKLYEQVVDMVCQAYSESSHKEATKYCDEALELNAESFWGLFHQGKSLLKGEAFEASIEALEKAAQAHPNQRDKVNYVLNKAHMGLKRSKTKDYYKILGVANDADERQIKSAYRKASKQFHPDKAAKQGVSKEAAEKKMAAINEAYEVLSDSELRARFDQGDDPNSQERGNPFQGSPFGGHPIMFQQQAGGQRQFKFDFGGPGGPFGF